MPPKGLHITDFKYHLLAIAAVAAWGVSYVSTRVLLDAGLTPIDAYIYRFVLAYLGFVVICRFKISIAPWRDELLMALCGLTGGAAYFLAENTAISLTLVSDVAVLVAVNPLFTTMLAAAFLHEEPFTWKKVFGSVIAFIGVGILTFYDGFVWGDGLIGDLLAIGAALFWSIYSVVLKRLITRYDALVITRKTFFYGLVFSLPVFFAQEQSAPVGVLIRPEVMANFLFLTLVCNMLAYFVWSIVTRKIGTILTANYLYLCPVVSVITAAVILGERIGAMGLAGCAIILTGIIIVERKD